MKYTSPIYTNEKIETADVMVTSPVAVAYVDKVIGKNEATGEDITVKATQVTVDVSNLF